MLRLDGMSLEIFRENNKKCAFFWSNSRYFCPFLGPMTTPFAVLIVSRVYDRQRSRAARNTAGSYWGSFEVSYACFIYLAFSWLAKANLAAFSCSLANLFSYLDTFLRVGLMNLPFMSLTEMVSSLI